MLISVVATTYKSEEYLQGFFENLLLQTYKNFEVVLVLNDPSEKELSILESYQSLLNIVYIKVPLELTSTSVNSGFKIAKGDIIVATGADDLFIENAFECFINAFLDNLNIDVIYCDHIAVDPTGKKLWQRTFQNFDFNILKKRYYMSPCNIFKRSILDNEDGFKEEYNLAADYEFMLRLASKGYKFLRIPKILFKFVRYSYSLTKVNSKAHQRIITTVRNIYNSVELME